MNPLNPRLDKLVEALAQQVGRCVRKRRMQLRLSQSALSKKSGLSRAEISYIELGCRRVRLDTLCMVSFGLGTSLLVLLAEALHEEAHSEG